MHEVNVSQWHQMREVSKYDSSEEKSKRESVSAYHVLGAVFPIPYLTLNTFTFRREEEPFSV